jgi:putative transposase
MTDNGAAMLAEETTAGLARLGVLHQTTLPYSPYQYVAHKFMWSLTPRRRFSKARSRCPLT